MQTKKGENIVLSPMSVILLLEIAADAVSGKTKAEILNVIGIGTPYEELIEVLKKLQEDSAESGSLMSSNAVCVKDSISGSIIDGYAECLKEFFDGKLFSASDIVRDVNA